MVYISENSHVWASKYDWLNDILGKKLCFWILILFPILVLFLMGLILIFSIYPSLIVGHNLHDYLVTFRGMVAFLRIRRSYDFSKYFTALQDVIVIASDYCFYSCWYIRMCFALLQDFSDCNRNKLITSNQWVAMSIAIIR